MENKTYHLESLSSCIGLREKNLNKEFNDAFMEVLKVSGLKVGERFDFEKPTNLKGENVSPYECDTAPLYAYEFEGMCFTLIGLTSVEITDTDIVKLRFGDGRYVETLEDVTWHTPKGEILDTLIRFFKSCGRL